MVFDDEVVFQAQIEILADDRVHVVVSGSVDLWSESQFSEVLDAAAALRPGALVVDLRGVDFLSASSLRHLIRVRDVARGRGLDFVVHSPPAGIVRWLLAQYVILPAHADH
ncbi:STAS domain-containing protein [Geodermatophilus normandii]|uniref:STAS domain-containing protein n=1 Tax=Geodermatophilus normandii TaxID=1137989 RepID=A0A6P0GII0_9ACTN|nr:STAS domain-containing protein [Geodermatophilus normandii]NEM07087.1 STAS domain-containing protein [Geodermatophilus normandii]